MSIKSQYLKGVIGCALMLKDATRIISQFVDISISSDKLFEDISLKKNKKLASDRVEKEISTFILEKIGWNRSHAAKILKISYKTLLYKIQDFEVKPLIKNEQPNHTY